jgi:predicted amidohydrolase YtcJ
MACRVIAATPPSAQGARLPPRIEHAGNFVPDLSQTSEWRRAGILPVPQPPFIYGSGDVYFKYLGREAGERMWPFRSLLAQGWSLPGNSDVWVGSDPRQTNPLFGIWAAVTRKTFHGNVHQPAEAISVQQGLEMYTASAAKVLGREQQLGTIAVGRNADLTILERDPRAGSPDQLLDLQTDAVLVDGVAAHVREDAAMPRLDAQTTGNERARA